MEKKFKEIFESLRKRISGNDLKIAAEMATSFAGSLKLVNIHSLFMLESEGNELYAIARGFGEGALITFIIDTFIKNPELQEFVNKEVAEIRTRLVVDFDGDATVH